MSREEKEVASPFGIESFHNLIILIWKYAEKSDKLVAIFIF